MKYLFDTHVLLWLAEDRLKQDSPAREIVESASNELFFSALSIWEIAIKSSLGRDDFQVDAAAFRRELFDNGYQELPINGMHAFMVQGLPPFHKDPFDRLLIAQARVEGMTLVSADEQVIRYGGSLVVA